MLLLELPMTPSIVECQMICQEVKHMITAARCRMRSQEKHGEKMVYGRHVLAESDAML